MKILLCGGLGFIGKNFLALRPKNWEIVSLDLIQDNTFAKKIQNAQFYQVDLSNKDKVNKLSKRIKEKFDACLFLAANGDPALSVADPAWDLKSTTLTLINVCQSFSIKKFVYLSSGAVYDENYGLVTQKSKIDPTLPYAISHLAAEYYARFFQKQDITQKYIIIRFFGAYGPNEPSRKIYTNLVKNIAIKKNSTFTIRGNGKNLIDAMYIENVIQGFVKVISSNKGNLIVDFCKGDHPNINQLVKEAARIFKRKIKIIHKGKVPEYNQFYASSNTFNRLFGFKPKISLEEGLKKLYQYYVKKK